MTVLSKSPEQTMRLGELVGRLARPADVICLTGELGSGKTRFAGGVAEGVGVDSALPVTSPSYTLLNIYSGRFPLYHFDLYRLRGAAEVAELGFEEYVEGDGIALIEWAERLQELLPEERLAVMFAYRDEQCREIVIEAHGQRYREIVEALETHLREALGQ